MIFRDVVVAPFTDLLEKPIGGHEHRGGPSWPDFDRQTLARHCRNGRPIDVVPVASNPTARVDERVAWGGAAVRHYGHAVADFSMRLLPTITAHGPLPVIFTTKPQKTGIKSLEDVPAYVRAIWSWFGVTEPRLLTEATIVRQLVVEPQAEQLLGPGPTDQHLDRLDELVSQRLGTLVQVPVVYVSRAGQIGRFAGEEYIEQAMTAAAVVVVRPEELDLIAQLRLYAGAERLIFAEGSAIHTLQLLGRCPGDVAVIGRRNWRFGEPLLAPRTHSVRWVNVVRGLIPGVLPTGGPDKRNAICILDPDQLGHNLVDLVPGIPFDPRQYERERDADVIRWLAQLYPTGTRETRATINGLVESGVGHLERQALVILESRQAHVPVLNAHRARPPGPAQVTETELNPKANEASVDSFRPRKAFTIPHPFIPPATMRNQTEDAYLDSAVNVIQLVDDLAGIPRSAHILDVGCAAGRLALPLLEYLDQAAGGSYVGFDVKEDRITWARQHISMFYPHFRFEFINVVNATLNPSGTVTGSSLHFPYDDNKFDVALLHSVFTHLLPDDTWHYLAELRRCLAPGGRIYSTWYLWDDATARSLVEHDVLWHFPVARDSHRVMDAARPELVVSYLYDRLMLEIDRNDLRVAIERRGNWRSQRTPDEDILILEERDAPGD